MAHRTFTDADGVDWEVWDVYPGWADRRHGNDRRDAVRAAARRDRRALLGKRIGVRAELAEGWLCFRGGGEKRRVVPIPHGWEELDTAELSKLARSAPASRDQSRSV